MDLVSLIERLAKPKDQMSPIYHQPTSYVPWTEEGGICIWCGKDQPHYDPKLEGYPGYAPEQHKEDCAYREAMTYLSDVAKQP